MAGLANVGRASATSTDLVRKVEVDNDYANATVSQTAVAGQVGAAVAGLASTVTVNNGLAVFAQPNYYQTQDALLLPLTSVGAASVVANPTASPPVVGVQGVASLDSGGKIPTAQVPVLGSGFVSGAWGPTATFNASATTTPVKIADWNIGASGVPFQPMAFMSLLIKAVNRGRPVVEIWLNAAPATYGTGTLVARGRGRDFWNDFMTVNVVPVPSKNAQVGGVGFAATYTAWFTAWMYDATGQGVSLISSNIVNAGIYLMRYQA